MPALIKARPPGWPIARSPAAFSSTVAELVPEAPPLPPADSVPATVSASPLRRRKSPDVVKLPRVMMKLVPVSVAEMALPIAWPGAGPSSKFAAMKPDGWVMAPDASNRIVPAFSPPGRPV